MQDAGMDVPALAKQQSLIGYDWLWEAFWDLNTCRQIGFGVGPIPWTAIQQYAEVEGLDHDETYLLHKVIKHMDAVYRDFIKEKENKT